MFLMEQITRGREAARPPTDGDVIASMGVRDCAPHSLPLRLHGPLGLSGPLCSNIFSPNTTG